MYIIRSNFVTTGQTIADIWRIIDFHNGISPPSWIFKKARSSNTYSDSPGVVVNVVVRSTVVVVASTVVVSAIVVVGGAVVSIVVVATPVVVSTVVVVITTLTIISVEMTSVTIYNTSSRRFVSH